MLRWARLIVVKGRGARQNDSNDVLYILAEDGRTPRFFLTAPNKLPRDSKGQTKELICSKVYSMLDNDVE